MSSVQLVPINKIRVLNPRARNKAKFSEIVTNVSKVGLKRPITVCPRAGSGGEYDLVCGQGRLEAFRKARTDTRARDGRRGNDGGALHHEPHREHCAPPARQSRSRSRHCGP